MATRSAQTTKKPATTKLVVGTSRRPTRTGRPRVSKARLKEFIEDATTDAYGESEQRVGFLTMIQEHLEVPFETEVLGVPIMVTDIEFNDAEEIVASCRRGSNVQRIPVLDLPLPKPPPEGFEWIEAYRFFLYGGD